MYGLGYIPSPPDSRDVCMYSMPAALSVRYELPDMYEAYNQYDKPICAAVSIAESFSWQRGLKSKWKTGFADPNKIFRQGSGTEHGMIIRDALKMMKSKGYDGVKIKMFSRIKTREQAKTGILVNGPIIIGTKAYNDRIFWQETGKSMGGHATVLVGWDEKGFTLQNSWGKSWGKNGRMTMSYADFDKYVIECWTLVV